MKLIISTKELLKLVADHVAAQGIELGDNVAVTFGTDGEGTVATVDLDPVVPTQKVKKTRKPRTTKVASEAADETAAKAKETQATDEKVEPVKEEEVDNAPSIFDGQPAKSPDSSEAASGSIFDDTEAAKEEEKPEQTDSSIFS